MVFCTSDAEPLATSSLFVCLIAPRLLTTRLVVYAPVFDWCLCLVLSSDWLWVCVHFHCSVPFGVLFRDDKCANLFEALMGTLRAAKRRKVIDFEGEMLFQGVHDDVAVSLVG